jgi:hypothetical protein
MRNKKKRGSRTYLGRISPLQAAQFHYRSTTLQSTTCWCPHCHTQGIAERQARLFPHCALVLLVSPKTTVYNMFMYFAR